MFRSSLWVALFAVALVSGPAPVLADSSVAATGVVSTGFTDNILGVPETDDPTATQVQSDGFMNLGPGLGVAHETRRAIHNLAYIFNARLFARHSEANSYTNRLTYAGLYFLSPVSSLRSNAGFASGRINNFDRSSGDFVGEVDDIPRGDVAFVTGQANLSYRRTLSPFWAYGASMGVRGYRPTNTDNVSTNYAILGSTSLEKAFRYHVVGASVAATFSNNARPGELPDQQAIAGGPRVFWTWDISRRFSSQVFAGATMVVEAPELVRGIMQPTGGVTVNYRTDRGRASASWVRGVAANIFTSDITVSDRYVLRLDLPVPFSDRLGLNGSIGYRRGRYIDLMTEELRGLTEQFSTNLGAGYAINQAWTLAARFQSVRQLRDNPITSERQAISRRTVTLVLSGRFPTQVATSVPPEGVRVDEVYESLADGGGAAGDGR